VRERAAARVRGGVGGRLVDELDEREDMAVRLNALIRTTAVQAQQLINEYQHSPSATVAGLASLGEPAIVTLETLSEEKKRAFG
jgi:hypothetical protein